MGDLDLTREVLVIRNTKFSKDRLVPFGPRMSVRLRHYIEERFGSAMPEAASPRLHDLRHSFAVRTLLHWYRSGIDPNLRLLHLSTFLGHVDPESTAVYLTITDELLDEANGRFHDFAKSLLNEEGLP